MAPNDTDTVVVGASAAGLAVAAQLRAAGVAVELLEQADCVGAAWRGHYDRLRLHTPKSSSALPGLAMPVSFPRYPSRDQVVEYLEAYRRRFALAPHFGERVQRVERVANGFETATGARVWRSRRVVIATGRARLPVRPSFPGLAGFAGEVLHSSQFRNGAAWRSRRVLVVGFGNSACEQALDLVEHGAAVHLAVRSPVNVVPRDVFGIVPVLQIANLMRRLPPELADALGRPIVRRSVGDLGPLGLRALPYGPNTQIARHARVPLLDTGTIAAIRDGRIAVHGDVAEVGASEVTFADGARMQADAIVLGTGYRAGVDEFLTGWRQVCDETGTPCRSGRPTGVEGLYFCGMHIARGGVLREIGVESRRIAALVAAQSARRPPARRTPWRA